MGDVDVADQVDRGVDHVEVAQPEEVHLEQAELLDVPHGELRHDLGVAPLLLERDDLDERAVGDDDAGGVDRVLANEALERTGEVDDLAHDLVRVVGLAQLRAGLQRLLEVDLRPLRDQLRDLVDDAVGNVEDATGVADGRTGHHRAERDDLGDPVSAVLVGHVVDHAVATVDGEVDVDVGHRLPTRVEETLEQELVADRVDVGDAEAVGDERSRCGAAAGADADPASPRERDEVRHDQEVVREAHLPDRLQLERETVAQLGRLAPVALHEAGVAEPGEILERIAPVRSREPRQQDPAELHAHVAALGDLERARHRLGEMRERGLHLLGGLEVELVGVELPVARVRERVAGLDTEQRLVRPRVLVAEVVDVAGRDERDAGARGKIDELRVERLLHLEPRILELDVGLLAAEDVHEPLELRLGLGRLALLERLRDAARQTAGEGDEPLRVRGEQVPVDSRLVVVALEVAG